MNSAGFSVGCDIGGTFTDVVLRDRGTGQVWLHKLLSTPNEPSDAVIDGIRSMIERFVPSGRRVDDVVHASTIANNLVLERKGAVTGLLATRGFRDLIEMRRQERYDMYDIQLDVPVPLVPRNRRYEITGRIDRNGDEVKRLDLAEVDAAVADLLSKGATAIAVCYLHSYRNPAHELETAARIARIAPHVSVSISSQVLPEIREYERSSTTVVDAYVKPKIADYLDRLESRLDAMGLTRLRIMLSGGSLAPAVTARECPVRMIESGPSAGVLAVQHYAGLLGLTRCLAFDIGGTTAKAGLIVEGEALRTSTYEIAHAKRFKSGSGIPLQVPAIHLLEMGSGGGSIAFIDALGMLEVGPQSAGAVPGPVCYGRGGTSPTVSDADLLLGYLDPELFASGGMTLSVAAAERAMETRIAQPLGVNVIGAAAAIHDLVNEKMAASIRMYCLENGEDPSQLTLVASGGAGPVHAYGVARKLGMSRVIIPPTAGAMSAAGLLTAQSGFDLARTIKRLQADVSAMEVRRLVEEMRDEAARALKVAPSELTPTAIFADMRYVGQGFDVAVPMSPSEPSDDNGTEVPTHNRFAATFEEQYIRLYGHRLDNTPIEITRLRVTLRDASASTGEMIRPGRRGSATTPIAVATRPLHFPDQTWGRPAPVYDRADLCPGVSLNGPLVIRDPETASVVGPDCSVTMDSFGGLMLQIDQQREIA